MKTLYALTVLTVINLGFQSTPGQNENIVGFENRWGNKIYVKCKDDCVEISAFKVSKRCLNSVIVDESEIEAVVQKLRTLVKCN
jgi:hypothetical protein